MSPQTSHACRPGISRHVPAISKYSQESCAHVLCLCFVVLTELDGGHCRFDGDGMLHAVRIKDGKAAYSNAYVQTSRFNQEKKAGRPLRLRVTTIRLHTQQPRLC